jgi:hypothetical protein
VALAVLLDVVNAFNSISWDGIDRVLEFHRLPAYLRGVVQAFLRDRSIIYTGRGGRMMGRAELVMLRNETVKRVRERDSHPERIGRRGRSGDRGRAYTGRARATATSDGG